MDIYIGTYEHYVLKYNLPTLNASPSLDDSPQLQLSLVFANNAPGGVVGTVGVCGRHLVAGSSDEMLWLYDVSKNQEAGALQEHSASITVATFVDKHTFISAAEDGLIKVFETKEWSCLKSLKGHKGPVFHISVHPSGLLALSVGKDHCLKLWDLQKGKCVYSLKLKSGPTQVHWSPSGSSFALLSGCKVNVRRTGGGESISVYRSSDSKPIHCVAYLSEDRLAIGAELEHLIVADVSTGEEVFTVEKAHEKRIKCIKCLRNSKQTFLVSASSAGTLKVWSYINDQLLLLARANSNCRIVCLDAALS